MIWRVLLGTFSIVLTAIVLGYVAITEQDRMASFETAYDSRRIETGAALYEANCQRCHGSRGEGGIGPAISTIDLFNGQRLAEMEYQGSLEAYLRGVLNAGRPRASAAYANAAERMPAWGQAYGGPLRPDQVEALVYYIINWGEQYRDASGKIPSATPTPNPNAAGTDITIELPAGDAARGKTIAESTGACAACHILAAVGPAWEAAKAKDGIGVGTHATQRFTAAGYAGTATTPEQYLYESIVLPNAYIVPPQTGDTWPAGGPSTMSQDYGTKLLKQDVADLIAYLLTIK
jgi:mono/diheme cytochrome c family protein